MTPTAISALRQRIQTAVEAGQIKQIALAKGASIDPAQLSRFLKGGGGISDAQLAVLQTSFDNLVEAPDPLPPEYALRLAKLLRDDKLVLFVGAGLSMQCPPVAAHDKGFPSWGELVEIVAEQFDADVVNAADFRSAPTVFFDYVRALDDGEAKLKAALRSALDSSRVSVAPAHTVLARLPWAEVWTTNYDDILERAFHAKQVNGNADHSLIALYTRQKTPFVLHLHGTVNDPHTLGKRSYEQWPQNNEKLISHLRNTLLNGRTALFVGYGMGDPNLDSEFGWLRNVTDNDMRLYGFLHNVSKGLLRAYEASINLHAVSLSSNAEYVAAFRQIEREYRVLTGELARGDVDTMAASIVADTETSADAYERTQLAVAMRRRWDDSGVAGLYLTDAKYRADDLGVDHVFVEPSVANWSAALSATVWSSAHGVIEVWREDGKPIGWDVADSEAPVKLRSTPPVAPPPAEPALASLARQRLVVLLGDPGSGKSLLLRKIARTAAEAWQNASSAVPSPLPIYLRLNAWESRQSASATDVALLNVVRDELLTYADVPREQIQQWTSSDRPILWLLDGLDEVRSQAARDGVREAVATLARTRPQDRFIVSARPSGYRTRFDGQWRELELQPLNDDQQTAVLERWRKITADRDNLTLDVSGLVKDLKASRALSDLRGNPLMLTLAILFYRIKRRLPRDRWEYYEIVDTNLRDQLARQRALREQPVERERRAWADILGRIALSGMRAGLAEDGRGKVRFSRDEIETIVVEYHRAQQCTLREALAEAERFLRAADDLLGVIVAFAPDEYGFLHLTFQEYHAARRLLQMNLPHEKAEREQLMADAWDHPDWKEVWQLVVLGAVDTGHPEVFEALCASAQENGWAEIDVLLPRRELQQLEWAGLVGARVFGTVAWARIEAWTLRQIPSDVWPRRIAETLGAWSWPLPTSLKRSLLTRLGDLEDGVFTQGCVALSLASSATEPDVRNSLLTVFVGAASISGPAIEFVKQALVQVASDAGVQHGLLSLIRDEDADHHVRRHAALLVASVSSDSSARAVLLKFLLDGDENIYSRRNVANEIAIVISEPAVRDSILKFIRGKKFAKVITTVDLVRDTCAVIALAGVATEPTVRQILTAILTNGTLHKSVRAAAAEALANVATEPDVRDALLKLLRQKNVGEDLLRGLLQAAVNVAMQPAVREAVLTILNNRNASEHVRGMAAHALACVATEPSIRDVLLGFWQEQGARGYAIQSAVQALTSVAAEPLVRDALLVLLRDPNANGYARLLALQALTPAVAEHPVLDAMLATLQSGKSTYFLRGNAARALSSVASQPVVREALRSLLGKKADVYVRDHAVHALSSVAFRARQRRVEVGSVAGK